MRRHSIAWSLTIVAMIAIGLAALRAASTWMVEVGILLVYGMLVVSLVGAEVRRRGAWWGFALVGWAYFLPIFAFGRDGFVRDLPTSRLLAHYISHMDPGPIAPPGARTKAILLGPGDPTLKVPSTALSPATNSPDNQYLSRLGAYNRRVDAAMRIGHLLGTVAFALLGAILGQWMERPGRQSRSRDVQAVYLEIDAAKERDGHDAATIKRSKERSLLTLLNSALPPHVVTGTKSGLQPIWRVHPIGVQAELRIFREAMEILRRTFGGDPGAKDPALVLRLPGYQAAQDWLFRALTEGSQGGESKESKGYGSAASPL